MQKLGILFCGSVLILSCAKQSTPLTEVGVETLGETSRVWELELNLATRALVGFREHSVVAAEKLARTGSWSLTLDDQQYAVAAPAPSSCVLPEQAGVTVARLPTPVPGPFIVTVPAGQAGAHFVLRDDKGTILVEGNLPAPTVTAHARSFTRAFRPRKSLATQVKAYHIYYLGHGYANQAELDTDITKFHSYLTATFPAYSEQSSRFVVLKGQPNFDLGCGADALVTRVYDCDRAKIEKAANLGGVAFDIAVVLIKSDVYGGAAHIDEKYITVTSRNDWSRQVEAHELGHVFGLADEYTYQSGVDDPYWLNISQPTGANCSMTNPSADPKWTGAKYFAGCEHANWFRSSDHSVMLDLTESFNSVSAGVIRDYFKKF